MNDITLNKHQKEAVEIIEGPVMVFAGAGTGKTRTLTYRVYNMLENGISPNNILAIIDNNTNIIFTKFCRYIQNQRIF